jgi:plasmid replication initiation protein
MPKVKQKKNRGIALIRKSNDLIESRYKFDIWEVRFFLSVLAKIHRDDQEFDVYRIKYRDVIKDFSLKSAKSYALLREGAKSLMSKTVTINYEIDGVVRSEVRHLIRKIDYLEDTKGKANVENHEYIDVKIEEEMKPFLLQLSQNFTAYDLRNVANLGAYSIRIYELLKQYQSIGTRTLQADELRLMFQLEKEYPRFANFYQKIIEPAVAEINKHTDLLVETPEKIKDGNRVVAVKFKFTKKQNEEARIGQIQEEKLKTLLDDAEVVEIEDTASNKDKLYLQFEEIVVKNFGVTPSVFFQLVGKHTAAQIEQAIRVTRRMRANGQIKSNVSGYFVQALKKGYTDVQEEQTKKKAAEAEKQRLDAEAKAKQERINQRLYELTLQSNDYALRAIGALKLEEVYKIRIEEKEKELGRPLKLIDYRNDDLLAAAIRAKIIELEKDKFKDL